MHMKVVNGKVNSNNAKDCLHSGIGLQNVLRRLELLYTGKHTIDIKDEEDVFIVDLKLMLTGSNFKRRSLSTEPEKIMLYE